jgi:hypothetical protein
MPVILNFKNCQISKKSGSSHKTSTSIPTKTETYIFPFSHNPILYHLICIHHLLSRIFI